MLNSLSDVFDDARTRLTASSSVSQLLLMVSDGRGVFREGVETVKKAIRKLVSSGVFTVFVILDNPGGPERVSKLPLQSTMYFVSIVDIVVELDFGHSGSGFYTWTGNWLRRF